MEISGGKAENGKIASRAEQSHKSLLFGKDRLYYGPEFISHVLKRWTDKRGIDLEFIQPGNPQQNAYVEGYNRTVRYGWLSQYPFDSIDEVQNYATEWLWFYNHERPNKANGGLPPKRVLAAA